MEIRRSRWQTAQGRLSNRKSGNSPTVENPVEKVRRLNHEVGLANHTVLISKGGQDFGIDDSAAPIRESNGKIVGMVLIFRDVTQQRALEIALRSNERLALAGRLSASIAHEIHNPLELLVGVVALVEETIAKGRRKASSLES